MAVTDAIRESVEASVDTLRKLRGGYPGGWKKFAKGWQGKRPEEIRPFIAPTNPDDRRSRIPPLGLREYWYPALPAKGVSDRKPLGLKISDLNLVFFRDKSGHVQALHDVCPHRGAALSWGECVWKGFLSCAYHGATFDGEGECVEFITEGPESKMPGRLHARKFPTVSLKGVVFVWMGEGEPVAPQEDIPPEFFDEECLVQVAWDYWPMNWLVALENTFDAHNCFWVHRNALMMMRSKQGGRPRTPVGYRTKQVDNKVVRALYGSDDYYRKDGKIPYQMYYPRANAHWPLHHWRLLWTWISERGYGQSLARPRNGNGSQPAVSNPDEWGGIGFGQRLPSMRRAALGKQLGTRWCVPVEIDLTRLLYISASWPKGFTRFRRKLTWPYQNWLAHFNFQSQDKDAVATVQYQYPEFLSSTDSYVVAFRKLITDHARGLNRTDEAPEVTTAEGHMYESEVLLGQTSGPNS